MPLLAIYSRFSCEKQSEASIEDQVRRCREWGARNGYSVDDAQVFTDYAVSGASLNRPGFDALMAKVRGGEITTLLVESVDRLSRDQADALTLYRDLKFRGVRLVTVADGIDSDAKHGKLTYNLKALVSEVFLDDLRDKTRRGMNGRAHAGLATGGRLYGYTTQAQGDPRKPSGYKIVIDDEQARVVRSVFERYVAGRSTKQIARELNAARIAPPRASAGTRHKVRPAWANGSIAAMLANERYAGTWRFGERMWIKVPGSNRRVSRPAPAEAVIVQDRPDLAIVSPDVWRAVAERRAAVRATFTRTAAGNPKGRSASGRMNRHPISGLLYCECGSPFTVSRSRNANYLACADSKRGRCDRTKALREDIAETSLLRALRDRLARPEALVYIRKQIAARLVDVAKGRDAQAEEVRQRVAKAEKRLANVVTLLTDGDKSPALRGALRELEEQIGIDRRALAELETMAGADGQLPTVVEVLDQLDLVFEAVKTDPVAAREALRRYFRDGKITLTLGTDGVYVGRSELLPLVAFAEKEKGETPGLGIPPISAVVAGAGLGRSNTLISEPFEVRFAA